MTDAIKEASKMPVETKTKPTVASVFRAIAARAKQPSVASFIKEVRERSGSTTFDAKQLAWYRSQRKAGRLSPGRKKAAAN